MKSNANDSKNQQEGTKRRGFLKALGVATAGAAVAVAIPAHAAPALTTSQRTLLECFNELNDIGQKMIIDLADELILTLPRQGKGMIIDEYVQLVGAA